MARTSKLQKEHFNYFTDVMKTLEWDLHQPLLARGRIPPDWHEIARARGPRKKVKVTFYLEEDVLKFFRGLGRGHGARMNDVLRAWMHGRIAGLIDGPDAPDMMVAVNQQFWRPRIGDSDLADRAVVRTADGRLWDLDAQVFVGDGDFGIGQMGAPPERVAFRSRRGGG